MNTRATTAAPEPLIALGLAAGPVVALGFTRFAYALLLPAMKTDLHAPDVDIADALAETVARLGTDLVIAAPHHRAHLQRWLEPSISEELADRAKAAVLLVA